MGGKGSGRKKQHLVDADKRGQRKLFQKTRDVAAAASSRIAKSVLGRKATPLGKTVQSKIGSLFKLNISKPDEQSNGPSNDGHRVAPENQPTTEAAIDRVELPDNDSVELQDKDDDAVPNSHDNDPSEKATSSDVDPGKHGCESFE